jgi:hypothetical protein
VPQTPTSALSFDLQPEMEVSLSLLELTVKLKIMDMMHCTFLHTISIFIPVNWFVETKKKKE